MKFELLTAYALGELSGAQAKEIEAMIKENAEAKKFVEDVKATAQMIQGELKNETHLELSSEQKKSLFSAQKVSFLHKLLNWKILIPVASFGFGVLVLALLPTFKIAQNQQTEELALDNKLKPVEVALNEQKPMDDEALAPGKSDYDVKTVDEVISADSSVSESEPESLALGQTADLPVAPSEATASPPVVKYEPTKRSRDFTKKMAYSAGSDAKVGLLGSVKSKERIQDVGGMAQDNYKFREDHVFKKVSEDARSTFSIDVDTASYAIVRRYIEAGQMPPPDAVKVEEMINYFNYDYSRPQGDRPFSVDYEVTQSPWKKQNQLVRIGIRGKEIFNENRPSANLVFLIDVSGSMEEPNKLPLAIQSMKLLTERLKDSDKVSIVVYAGSSGLVLPPTRGSQKAVIMNSLQNLKAGGSTNGGQGIELAYQVAQKEFISDGINRVILLTDGDFNVGTTSDGDLIRLIQQKAKSKVFLSVVGFGMGNLKDSTMEQLAQNGNGQYAYIDRMSEAKKIFEEQLVGTLLTIAKDVKIQVEFNPKRVKEYKLIGYENRMLQHHEFNDDQKDAGDIGSGHTVTAIYEIVPGIAEAQVDPLKYQDSKEKGSDFSNELMTVKLRYKKPNQEKSELITQPIKSEAKEFSRATGETRWAALVAAFGMKLRASPDVNDVSYQWIKDQLKRIDSRDAHRKEFIDLVDKSQKLRAK